MKIHEVQEESPYSWLKRKTSHTIHKDQYSRAASKLHDILSRKHKETGGKLRHSLGYYAHMLSRQTGERLNWKELAQEYLDTFGGTYFENFDLDEFKIVKPDPKDTMGIKRNQMPQVATKDYPEFVEYLKDKGATFTKGTVKATSLKAIQGEFSDQGVEKQLKKLMNKEPKKPVIASSDDYIIDGHHRWLVALNTGDTVEVFRVNMPGQELLQLVKEFPKVTYKDIYNERLVQVDPKGPKNLKKLKKPSRYERRKQAAKAQDDIDEAWSKKYKKSIDCSNPKGFSQKAHCAGRKKTEDKNFGIPDGATLAQLDDIAKNAKTKEKRQRAHYLRNMRRGQNKTK